MHIEALIFPTALLNLSCLRFNHLRKVQTIQKKVQLTFSCALDLKYHYVAEKCN
jgi:hypothetical protein